MGLSKSLAAQNAVIVRKSFGGWVVVIIADGEEESQAFVTEEYAANFAVGQMVRLNLYNVIREDAGSPSGCETPLGANEPDPGPGSPTGCR